MRRLMLMLVLMVLLACVAAPGQSGFMGSLRVQEWETDHLYCGVLFRSEGIRGFSCARK
jgi:hypothetical protein